jgi:hypothetical protein
MEASMARVSLHALDGYTLDKATREALEARLVSLGEASPHPRDIKVMVGVDAEGVIKLCVDPAGRPYTLREKNIGMFLCQVLYEEAQLLVKPMRLPEDPEVAAYLVPTIM